MRNFSVSKMLFLVSLFVLVILSFYIFKHPDTVDRNHSIFVYGTLKYPIVRSVACWCITEATPSTLSDYRKEGLNIIHSQGDFVSGKIIHVNDTELARLDKYEDIPITYNRTKIEINNETHWVYVLNAENSDK